MLVELNLYIVCLLCGCLLGVHTVISVSLFDYFIHLTATNDTIQDILGHITEGVCRPFKVSRL